MTEAEQADLDLKKAQIKQTNANTSMTYMGQQVVSPEEVRKSLVKAGDFEIDTTFDDDDMNEEEMNELIEKIQNNGGFAPGPGGDSPDAAPAATKLPQDMTDQEIVSATLASQESTQQPPTSPENQEYDEEGISTTQSENHGSVGVLVIKDGKILVGIRNNDSGNGLICGPGGHIEKGETPEFAAARETSEEFSIIPNELIFIGRGEAEPEEGLEPYIYLCTDFDGIPKTDGEEMTDEEFLSLEDLEKASASLFAPFAYSLKVLKKELGFRVDGKRRAKRKNADSAKNTLDNTEKQVTINEKNSTGTNADGAPVGNQNAKGPHKKSGGKGYVVSAKERKKLNERFKGVKSSKGTVVKEFSDHAFDRVGGRAISAGRIQKMLDSTDTKPDKSLPDRTLYDFDGSRLVLADDGTIVTVMWIWNKRKK